MSGNDIDEIVEAPTADALLAEAKNRVSKELGWKGMFLKPLTPIQFAQLAVSKYNEKFGTSFDAPTTGQDFIKFGEATGNVEVLAP